MYICMLAKLSNNQGSIPKTQKLEAGVCKGQPIRRKLT